MACDPSPPAKRVHAYDDLITVPWELFLTRGFPRSPEAYGAHLEQCAPARGEAIAGGDLHSTTARSALAMLSCLESGAGEGKMAGRPPNRLRDKRQSADQAIPRSPEIRTAEHLAETPAMNLAGRSIAYGGSQAYIFGQSAKQW
jgi:hypothetical protein